MNIKLGRAIILVKDYDEAFRFYEKNLFCKKLFEHTDPNGQRLLHIGFGAEDSLGIWFLKADSEEQLKNVGNQTMGQPTLVFYTDDAEKLYHHLLKNGVELVEELVTSPESKYFHCLDLYGNRLTCVEFVNSE